MDFAANIQLIQDVDNSQEAGTILVSIRPTRQTDAGLVWRSDG
jgi:hypothetical protein